MIEKISLLTLFLTMLQITFVTYIFILSKDGIVRKAMIFFFITFCWSTTSRFLSIILDYEFPALTIAIPIWLSSFILLTTLYVTIYHKILKDRAEEKSKAIDEKK